jgi:hypothetical protein
VFQFIGRVDRVLLFLNLILLMFVAAIPFTTSLLAEYLTAGGRDARAAAVVYSAVMLAMAVAFSLVFGWAAIRPGLLREGVDPAAARAAIPRLPAAQPAQHHALGFTPPALADDFLLTPPLDPCTQRLADWLTTKLAVGVTASTVGITRCSTSG